MKYSTVSPAAISEAADVAAQCGYSVNHPGTARLAKALDTLQNGPVSPAPVPTATKAVAEDGAFSLSDNQRDSLRRMALIATSTGDFSVIFGQIELLVASALFDRSIADGRKAIGEVFRHARGQMGGDE